MNRHAKPPRQTDYEADFAQWCAEQATLLQQGDLNSIDRDNIADEIESLGESEKVSGKRALAFIGTVWSGLSRKIGARNTIRARSLRKATWKPVWRPKGKPVPMSPFRTNAPTRSTRFSTMGSCPSPADSVLRLAN